MFFKDTVGARAFAALAWFDTLLAAYTLHLCLPADGASTSAADDGGLWFWMVENIELGLRLRRERLRELFREHDGWRKGRGERESGKRQAGRRGREGVGRE